MNFARGIIKHRDDLRYADAGAGHADLTAWRGRARKRPCHSRSPSINDSLFVGTIDGIGTHLEGASFEQAAEEPATANFFANCECKIPPRRPRLSCEQNSYYRRC